MIYDYQLRRINQKRRVFATNALITAAIVLIILLMGHAEYQACLKGVCA